MSSSLPSEYKKLQWIANNGKQYINTGFYPNQDTRVIVKAQQISSNTYPRIFGSGLYNASGSLCLDFENGKICVKWGNQSGWKTASIADVYGLYTYDINKNVFYIDGVETLSVTYSASSSSNSIYLFVAPNTASDEYFYGSIYFVKIYDNDVLVRDMVPCYRKSDNVAGLYDLVNDVFYTNNGSGTFTQGPVAIKYASTGTAIFNLEEIQEIDAYDTSNISWYSVIPDNTNIKVEAKLDSGSYTECSNGSPLPVLVPGGDYSESQLELKVTMSTDEETATPELSNLHIYLKNADTTDTVLLTIKSGNANSFQNAVGSMSIEYSGGNLKGSGGNVEDFTETFTPIGLVPKNNQNHTEHIDVDVSATGQLKGVTYINTKEDEHIDVDISAVGNLLAVTYIDSKEDEHIEVDISASGTLTSI